MKTPVALLQRGHVALGIHWHSNPHCPCKEW